MIDMKKDFATVVAEARAAKGLTMQKLADKVGTEKGYISGIQNRKVNPPSPKITKRLAKVLGLDPIELLILGFIEKAPFEIRDLVREGTLAALEAEREESKKELVPVV